MNASAREGPSNQLEYHNDLCRDENCAIAIAMSSSHADPVLGLNILQGLTGGI